jgi:hypothetical protein
MGPDIPHVQTGSQEEEEKGEDHRTGIIELKTSHWPPHSPLSESYVNQQRRKDKHFEGTAQIFESSGERAMGL